MFDKLKNSKTTMRLLSIILAIIIWLVIIYTINPVISQQVNFVPVTFSGEGDLMQRGFTILNKEDIDTVRIKVRGPRNSVIKAMSTMTAKVNLSDVTEVGEWTGTATFDVGVSGVSIDGKNTAKVALRIDRYAQKEVPVIVSKIGEERDNDKIMSAVPEFDTVLLSGAKTEVDRIKAVIVPIDASKVDEEKTEEYEWHFVNNQDTKEKFTNVKIDFEKIPVTTKLMNKKAVGVNIVLTEDMDQYYLDVKDMSVDKIEVGVSDDNIDSIDVPFDLKDYDENKKEYNLKIDSTEKVFVPFESRDITAELQLKDMERAEISVDVRLKDIPDDKDAMLVKNQITLRIKKPEGVSVNGKIKAYASLKGLDVGSHSVEVELDSEIPVYQIDKPKVDVLIYKKG